MKDYLKEICSNSNIMLTYSENNTIVLSSGFHNDIPVIIAHNIFKNCPMKVAQAIISYHTHSIDKNKHMKIINKFIEEHFHNTEYKISPPDEKFENFLLNNIQPIKPRNVKDSPLHEMNISQITMKDFSGYYRDINSDDTIEALNDNITEVDITIDNTYRQASRQNHSERIPMDYESVEDEVYEDETEMEDETIQVSNEKIEQENEIEDQIISYNFNRKSVSNQNYQDYESNSYVRDDDVIQDQIITYYFNKKPTVNYPKQKKKSPQKPKKSFHSKDGIEDQITTYRY